MKGELIITVQDLYTVPDFKGGIGYCGPGARRWFAQYGFNWSDFVQHGLPASVLAATGDALALKVVAHAEQLQQAAREVTNG